MGNWAEQGGGISLGTESLLQAEGVQLVLNQASFEGGAANVIDSLLLLRRWYLLFLTLHPAPPSTQRHPPSSATLHPAKHQLLLPTQLVLRFCFYGYTGHYVAFLFFSFLI